MPLKLNPKDQTSIRIVAQMNELVAIDALAREETSARVIATCYVWKKPSRCSSRLRTFLRRSEIYLNEEPQAKKRVRCPCRQQERAFTRAFTRFKRSTARVSGGFAVFRASEMYAT